MVQDYIRNPTYHCDEPIHLWVVVPQKKGKRGK
jgi:hypothetical protein